MLEACAARVRAVQKSLPEVEPAELNANAEHRRCFEKPAPVGSVTRVARELLELFDRGDGGRSVTLRVREGGGGAEGGHENLWIGDLSC